VRGKCAPAPPLRVPEPCCAGAADFDDAGGGASSRPGVGWSNSGSSSVKRRVLMLVPEQTEANSPAFILRASCLLRNQSNKEHQLRFSNELFTFFQKFVKQSKLENSIKCNSQSNAYGATMASESNRVCKKITNDA
jgi:hypothetical protein